MKKIYLTIFAMMLVLAAGCGQTQVESPDTHNESPEPTPESTQVSQQQEQVEKENAGHEVTITQNGVVPATLSVGKGDTVVWVNRNRANHELLSESGYIHSGNLSGKQAYSKEFTEKGTYDYKDTVSEASGTIIVE